MTREEAIMELNQFSGTTQLKLSANFWTALNMAIKAIEQQDKILQILDDYELEAWEILEKIKEVVRV